MSLCPTEKFSFTWLSGTQEEDLSSRSGELLSGGLGLVPFGSDWQWLSGGFITELLVSSVWVNGLADASLAFNRTEINLDTGGQYIEITPVTAPRS